MRVCVFGSSEILSEAEMKQAYLLGRNIAGHGHSLTYGGFSSGLLAQVAMGVKSEGGSILAVAPLTPRKGNPLYAGIDTLLTSQDKRVRKQYQAENADMFIVLPEGIGVMDELFEILVLKSYGELNADIWIVNINERYNTLKKLLAEQNALDLCRFCSRIDEIEL